MPQLDFREALSTPEEKLFPPPPSAAMPAAIPVEKNKIDFLARRLRLTRSTWTNIIFVAIASVGGLFSAFYFFNGAEVLRAAAAWPNEFLYPRPISTDRIDGSVQPDPVDRFSDATASSEATKGEEAKGPFDQDIWPSDLSQPPSAASGTIAFSESGIISLVPSDPGASLFSTVTSVISGLNLLPPGGDSLFQSLYQTATSMTSSTTKTVKRTVRNTITATRRKIVSTTAQKLTTVTQKSTSSASSTMRSTTQNLQQTAVNQTQVTGLNSISAPNQTMMGRGLSGVGTVGTGVGLGNLGSGIIGQLPGHH